MSRKLKRTIALIMSVMMLVTLFAVPVLAQDDPDAAVENEAVLEVTDSASNDAADFNIKPAVLSLLDTLGGKLSDLIENIDEYLDGATAKTVLLLLLEEANDSLLDKLAEAQDEAFTGEEARNRLLLASLSIDTALEALGKIPEGAIDKDTAAVLEFVLSAFGFLVKDQDTIAAYDDATAKENYQTLLTTLSEAVTKLSETVASEDFKDEDAVKLVATILEAAANNVKALRDYIDENVDDIEVLTFVEEYVTEISGKVESLIGNIKTAIANAKAAVEEKLTELKGMVQGILDDINNISADDAKNAVIELLTTLQEKIEAMQAENNTAQIAKLRDEFEDYVDMLQTELSKLEAGLDDMEAGPAKDALSHFIETIQGALDKIDLDTLSDEKLEETFDELLGVVASEIGELSEKAAALSAEEAKELLGELLDAAIAEIQGVIETIDSVAIPKVAEYIAVAKEVISKVAETIKNFDLKAGLQNMLIMINDEINYYRGQIDAMTGDEAKEALQGVIIILRNKLDELSAKVDQIPAEAQEAYGALIEALSEKLDELSAVVNGLSADQAKEALQKVLDAVEAEIAEAKALLDGLTIENIKETISQFFNSMIETIEDLIYGDEEGYTGFVECPLGVIIYVTNGKLDTSKNGVVADPHSDDKYYCLYGVVLGFYTSVEQDGRDWIAIIDGKFDPNYVGFLRNGNGWWYLEDGKVAFGRNDIIKGYANINTALIPKEGWWYVVSGKVTDATTVAKNSNGWWFVREGQVDFDYDGVQNNANGWWAIQAGKVNFNYKGFLSNEYGWWYLENGKVSFGVNDILKGVANNDPRKDGISGWWYVEGSKVVAVSTVAKNANGWWYVNEGMVDFDYTGVQNNANGWWAIQNGKVNFGFKGFLGNEYGWWYLENGKVSFGVNDVINGVAATYYGGKTSEGWWLVRGSKVTKDTVVAKNSNGWWYCKDGKVDFTYTGLGTNEYGEWYCSNGKVDFTYNGVYDGKTIVNGKVVA